MLSNIKSKINLIRIFTYANKNPPSPAVNQDTQL